LIRNFLDELGLKLEWYKDPTGKRVPAGGSEFGRFASKIHSTNTHDIAAVSEQRYDLTCLNDYIILAKKRINFKENGN